MTAGDDRRRDGDGRSGDGVDRRTSVGVTAMALLGGRAALAYDPEPGADMYGPISKIVAVDGRRAELSEILFEGSTDLPGCLSYVVAHDAEDGNAIWVTEVWESEKAHRESLSLPSVEDAMEKGRPLIEGFDARTVTAPVGGHGLG